MDISQRVQQLCEFKAIRRVRTPAGVRRYKQPIGSIIVRDGVLGSLELMEPEFDGWEKVRSKYTNHTYDLGYDDERDKWIATETGKWKPLVEADSEEDLYLMLDDKLTEPFRKPGQLLAPRKKYERVGKNTRDEIADIIAGNGNTLVDNYDQDAGEFLWNLPYDGGGVGGHLDERSARAMVRKYLVEHPKLDDTSREVMEEVVSEISRWGKVKKASLDEDLNYLQQYELQHAMEENVPKPIKVNEITSGMWVRHADGGKWLKVKRVSPQSSRSWAIDGVDEQGKKVTLYRQGFRDKFETVNDPKAVGKPATIEIPVSKPKPQPKALRDMSVAELRQHARDMGLSSVTRLTKKDNLIRAIELMQQRRPEVYGKPTAKLVTDVLKPVAAKYEGEERFKGVDGKFYDLGQDPDDGRWYATGKGGWDEIVAEGDTRDEAYDKLAAKLGAGVEFAPTRTEAVAKSEEGSFRDEPVFASSVRGEESNLDRDRKRRVADEERAAKKQREKLEASLSDKNYIDAGNAFLHFGQLAEELEVAVGRGPSAAADVRAIARDLGEGKITVANADAELEKLVEKYRRQPRIRRSIEESRGLLKKKPASAKPPTKKEQAASRAEAITRLKRSTGGRKPVEVSDGEPILASSIQGEESNLDRDRKRRAAAAARKLPDLTAEAGPVGVVTPEQQQYINHITRQRAIETIMLAQNWLNRDKADWMTLQEARDIHTMLRNEEITPIQAAHKLEGLAERETDPNVSATLDRAVKRMRDAMGQSHHFVFELRRLSRYAQEGPNYDRGIRDNLVSVRSMLGKGDFEGAENFLSQAQQIEARRFPSLGEATKPAKLTTEKPAKQPKTPKPSAGFVQEIPTPTAALRRRAEQSPTMRSMLRRREKFYHLLGSQLETKGDSEVHTGAMVALLPSHEDIERLVIAGGEKPDQLHLTLYYLGEAKDLDVVARQDITNAVRRFVRDLPEVKADVFAVNFFNPEGENPCFVYGVSGDELPTVHAKVCAAVDTVANTLGLGLPKQHRPWIPHITAAYSDDEKMIERMKERTGPVLFDRVRVVFAGEATDIPFDSSPAESYFGKRLQRLMDYK